MDYCITCAILSSSAENVPASANCIRELRTMITERGATRFLAGIERETLAAAEAVLSLKKEFPGITLECVISHEELTTDWPEEERDRFFTLMEHCDRETLISHRLTAEAAEQYRRYFADAEFTVIC